MAILHDTTSESWIGSTKANQLKISYVEMFKPGDPETLDGNHWKAKLKVSAGSSNSWNGTWYVAIRKPTNSFFPYFNLGSGNIWFKDSDIEMDIPTSKLPANATVVKFDFNGQSSWGTIPSYNLEINNLQSYFSPPPPTTASGGAPVLTASKSGGNIVSSWTDPSPLPTTGNWDTTKLYYMYGGSSAAAIQSNHAGNITAARTFNNVNASTHIAQLLENFVAICAVEYFEPSDGPSTRVLGPLSNIVDLTAAASSCGSGSPEPASGQLGNDGVNAWDHTTPSDSILTAMSATVTNVSGDEITFDVSADWATGSYPVKLAIDNGWITDQTWTWVWNGNAPPTENRSAGDTQLTTAVSGIGGGGWLEIYYDVAAKEIKYCTHGMSITLSNGDSDMLRLHHLTLSPMGGSPTPPPPAPAPAPPPASIICGDTGGYNDSHIIAFFTVTSLGGTSSNRTLSLAFDSGVPNNAGAYQINNYADFLSFCTAAGIPQGVEITVWNSEDSTNAPGFTGACDGFAHTDPRGDGLASIWNIGSSSIQIKETRDNRSGIAVGIKVGISIKRFFFCSSSPTPSSPGPTPPGPTPPGPTPPAGPPSVSQPPMGSPSPPGSTTGPGNAGPPAPPVPANNPGNAGNGTGSTPLGSGIYQEFFTYTSSATEPAKVFRDITETQCISIDLKNREALASNNDAPSGDQPDNRPNGSDYYLYARWRDRSANISDLITTSFKIDNCDPYIVRHLNAAGYDQYACDWIYLNEEVTDDTSGVVYYTISVNGNIRKEVVDINYVNPNTYHINEIITIPSTPGTHNIEVRAYDQAENYVSNSFAVKRSAQTIVWNLLQAQRLPASPWMIEIRFKATISSNGPHLLEGYHSSMDHHWVVTPSAYWNGNQGQKLDLADTYVIIEPDLTKNHGVAFVRTHDPADYWYSAKEFDVDTSQNPITDPSSITSIDDPVISINDPTGRTFTNSLSNEWAIRAEAGNIHVNGGRDFLTGYLLTEDPSFTPSKAPEWDGQLQQFVDTAGDGWEAMVSFGTFGISRDDTFSFTGTFGTKTVYLWVSTHGHSGDVPGFPQKFFRAEYTIEYINDFVGPWCRNIDVEELDATHIDTTTKVYSDYADPNYNPIETYQRDSEVTSDNIRITGEVYDNESWVQRYVLGSYGVPPPYSQIDPGVWTVLDPPVTATNFSGTFQLAFPNSMKTHYLWAVDVCGNMSRTMISTELKNPDYIIPTQGGTVGSPYKFEGKADEHKLRESIVSMFGDGVFHTGMISNQTPKVRTNRVHKLSEYRGLRVANTQNIPASNEFLPFPTDPANPQQKGGEPLKFSDFLFKVPRIDDLFVNAYIPPDTPTNTTEPAFVGDVRNIALTMDIDSGNQPQEWKSINDNVIDDSATWTASFIPKGSGGSQNINVGTVVQGVIQGYRFDNPGVYIFIGTSSFGKTASRTYIIYEAGTPVPPTQGPPVKVGPIDLSSDPFGQTDIEIDYFVDQVSLAVDVVMCVDRSGSYVPGFSNSLYDACFPNPSKKVRLLCASYPGYYGVFAITNNLTSIDTEIKEAFVNLKYLLKDRGPITAADQVSSLSSITSPGGNLASDWPILPGLLTANGEQIYKLHETTTNDELVTTVMESAGLQAKEYADGSRDSHNSNSSSNRFNAYWFTDENFAEKTLVTAISQFARNSRTNFSDARFCIVWYWNPGNSGMAVTTGQSTFGDAWTKFIEKPYDTSILPNASHKSLQEGIKTYKDSGAGGDEPKVEAVARSATGEFPGAWRETAAKLVILFADECDGAPTNKSGGSSSSTYTDSGSSSYYRKLLIKNEVGFIYFDADKAYSNIPTKDQDGMLAATNATRKWGGLLDFLTLASSPSDIADKMDDAFDLYQAGVTFDLISAINPPVILIPSSIQAKTGAGAHAPGTVAPIPYSSLVTWPGGGYDYRKKAVFTAKLDNAAVGSLGTDYIITYISIKNSSGIEIARKEIQIQVKR